jgi:hypothetical protein
MSFISVSIRSTSPCVSVTTLKDAAAAERSNVLNVDD